MQIKQQKRSGIVVFRKLQNDAREDRLCHISPREREREKERERERERKKERMRDRQTESA